MLTTWSGRPTSRSRSNGMSSAASKPVKASGGGHAWDGTRPETLVDRRLRYMPCRENWLMEMTRPRAGTYRKEAEEHEKSSGSDAPAGCGVSWKRRRSWMN